VPDGRRPILAAAETRAPPRTLANATILQIVPSLADGPAARTAVETACGLLAGGARTMVAGAPGPLIGKLQTAGSEWIPLQNDTVNPLKLRRNAVTLERMIAAERIDIIHVHGAAAAWSALSAAARLPVWLVGSLPDAPLPRGRLSSFFAGALARCDRIIAPSSHAASHAIERFRIASERIAVIPRSVETHLFDPASIDQRRVNAFRAEAGIAGDEKAILVRGRIGAARGQHVLVEAAALLAERGRRGCVYLLAGDDQGDRAYLRRLKKRITGLGLEPIFRFVPVIRDRPAALAASHLVIVPALEPPASGQALAEAQAMARPVIASEIGLLPEHLLAPPRMPDELRTGWLVPPGDARELAEAIGVALDLGDTAYQALAARGRQYARYVFSPESVVSATRAVYAALLAREA
jgi:glycosyltransferase involved in cell wall biosynthesis